MNTTHTTQFSNRRWSIVLFLAVLVGIAQFGLGQFSPWVIAAPFVALLVMDVEGRRRGDEETMRRGEGVLAQVAMAFVFHGVVIGAVMTAAGEGRDAGYGMQGAGRFVMAKPASGCGSGGCGSAAGGCGSGGCGAVAGNQTLASSATGGEERLRLRKRCEANRNRDGEPNSGEFGYTKRRGGGSDTEPQSDEAGSAADDGASEWSDTRCDEPAYFNFTSSDDGYRVATQNNRATSAARADNEAAGADEYGDGNKPVTARFYSSSTAGRKPVTARFYSGSTSGQRERNISGVTYTAYDTSPGNETA